MHMESVRLDKPVYVTMTILDDSKTQIYDFTTTRSKSSTVLKVNTERLLLEIQTDVVYNVLNPDKG